ncbi:hypothetical protein BL254_23035 [Protofrankia sp. BMG5.30]|nr:hypothetical protein BL254_23035 [Protofrankia sp. BMG5.30]
MFGPREVLLTSEEPVVQQFLQGRRAGPIGMSEEKDSAQMQAEMAQLREQGAAARDDITFVDPQYEPSAGLPERRAVQRRKDRVMEMLHTLPLKAQQAIRESLTEDDLVRYEIPWDPGSTEVINVHRPFPIQ